jgi:hypothetical protein
LDRFRVTAINLMKLLYRNSNEIVLARNLVMILLFSFNYLLLFPQKSENDYKKISEKNFSEELYIKTDRDLYIAGEKVWLKVFKLNGLNHTPENLSKVVYIDILDIYNNPIDQLKVGVDGYSGSASFNLPDTLSTGNYILRTYTNWMKNFSKDLFSYKKISVINPFENVSEIIIPSQNNIPDSVIFYPEGGQLITGIETLVGFRSIDKKGDPVAFKGAVIYENNDTICLIKSENNGYGWAKIKPSANSSIILVTGNKNGTVKKFTLPEIKNEGITLSVVKKSENSSSLLKIKRSQNFSTPGTKLYIRLHSAGSIDIRKEIPLESNHEMYLSKNDLPYGFSHLMVTDEHENQLADRWIYNETDNLINYSINILKNSFSEREKIEIGITATDGKGIPVESDLSISVVKTFTVDKNSFNNKKYSQLPGFATIISDTILPDINNYLLFYTSSDPVMKQDETNSNSFPVYLPELEGHLISGSIHDRKSGEPIKNENITLSFVGKSALCQFTRTDEMGNFNFVTTEHGLREIVIQPLSADIKDCYVELINPFTTTFNNYNHGLYYIDSSKLGDINKAIISMQIKNIYEPFMQQAVNRNIFSEKPNFYGAPDNTIQMSKYIELTSLKEVVKEIIPGVSTIKKNDKINFKLIYKAQSQPFDNSPLVLVDGVPVNDLEKVLTINSREIEKIDVLSTRYFISDIVLDGVLHFVTKKGNLGVLDFDKSVYRLEYELLQNNNKFYSPDYSSVSIKDNRIPDFRNTLYWNPDLHTDNLGKTSVDFYASDESAEYIIIVEGISPDGKSGISTVPLIIKSR